MPLELNLDEQETLAATFVRRRSTLTSRERISEAVAGGAFLLAVAGIWVLRPPRSFDGLTAALCFVVFVLATRVEFDTPLGFTAPTQLGFVPLVFAMPIAVVPLAVAAGFAVGRLPEVLTRKVSPSRLVPAVANSWFAIGPAFVFAVADTPPHDAGAALLLAALAAQFMIDFAASSIRFWIAREASFSEQLRDSWVYGVDAALSAVALVIAEAIDTAPIAALASVPLLGLLHIFAHERHERLAGLLELNTAYRGTAVVLADVIEADDWYTAEHSKGVVGLAVELAHILGVTAEQRRNVELAALLHDVGKIAIPKEIINKPGSLTAAEWTIIKTHTVAGQRMLDQVGGLMSDVGRIVRCHHEKWDGTGYPDGLAGEGIPIEARIISCADTWNAMRTDRSYRTALPHEDALAEIGAVAGRQLDPHVVDALLLAVERERPREPVSS